MSEISEDAIEAAAEVIHGGECDTAGCRQSGSWAHDIEVTERALAAALPFLERELRAKVGAALEAQAEAQKPLSHHYAVGVFDGLLEAARVARGGEATE